MLLRKEKLQSLIRFHSAIKLTSRMGVGGKKEKSKKKKIQKHLQNKSKHKNNKFFLSHCCQIIFLAESHSPLHLPRMLSNSVVTSGPAVGAAQILIWPYTCVFLPPTSTAITTSAFSFVGVLNVLLYIPQTVCLTDHVDLICSLYRSGEGFGSSSLATLPLCFNCGFIPTSACGLSTGVCS